MMKPPSLIQRLLPILHEDASFLAVDKPAGVDVGGLPHEPTAGLTELVAALRGRNETLHPVNRLSRFEPGVLLFGKDSAAAVRIRTRPQLASEMIALLAPWLPERTIQVLGDSEYAGQSISRHLPPNVHLTSRMVMNAALYDLPPKHQKNGSSGNFGIARRKTPR